MKYSLTLLTLTFFCLSATYASAETPPTPDESSLYGHNMTEYEAMLCEGALKSGAPLEEYLLLHQRLDALFLGLYGEAHPLQPHLTLFKGLTQAYAKRRKKLLEKRSFSREATEETSELAETLNQIKKQSGELLANFKVEKNTQKNNAPGSLPSAQEWQQLAQGQQSPMAPNIIVTPTTPPSQQDAAFKAFFAAMQQAQTAHPQLLADHDVAKKQVCIFIIGLVVIGLAYIVISKKIAPELADLGTRAGTVAGGYAELATRISKLLQPPRLTR